MDSILIFDYDGVIVDSLDMFMNFFINACKHHGWNQISTKEEFLTLFNGNMYENMMNHGMNKQDILAIVLDVKKGLMENLEHLAVFPKMKETLKTLSHDHILLISTSNDTSVVNKYLTLHDIDFFDNVYGSDIHPSKIKKIELIKNNYPATSYAYIGDTIGDIHEGKKAGIKTIGVTWGWHSKQQLLHSKPDYLAESIPDLIPIAKKIPYA